MKRMFSVLIHIVFVIGLCPLDAAQAVTEKDLESERLKLEVERCKLENQRLQLQIEKMQLQAPSEETPEAEGSSPKRNKAERKEAFALDVSKRSAELAKLTAADANRMVLDFTNGEAWYRGVRHSLNDLQELFDKESWIDKPKVEKRNPNGYARMKLAHLNVYGLKYEHRQRGVFVWEIPGKDGGFTFVTPEGFSSESPYSDIRNTFENAFFTYDRQSKKGKSRILRFKNKKGVLNFSDKLNFWFDKDDKLVKVEWGVLDEN